MATHPEEATAPEVTKKYVRYGASPRAAQAIISTSRIRALLSGRYNVSFEDIQKVAYPALRHRIFLNFDAVSDDMTPDKVIDALVKDVKTYRLTRTLKNTNADVAGKYAPFRAGIGEQKVQKQGKLGGVF